MLERVASSSSSSSEVVVLRESRAAADGGGAWRATTNASINTLLLIIVVWHFSRKLCSSFLAARTSSPAAAVPPPPIPNPPLLRTEEIVSDADLKRLIECLDEKLIISSTATERWEHVIHRCNQDNLSYTAKCCKPKDGPLKYMSVTVFEDCSSSELLRDFYMDNEYRKLWDRMIVAHDQLHLDESMSNGLQIGRTIKKFPLLTLREYILAWKLWEGQHKTFYCFIKECEHPIAPRQNKYVRVGFFRSGWRIRKVPGKNACEIKMVHQEDAGLNAEMAKLVFSKGIWGYVCKMNTALRGYAAYSLSLRTRNASAVHPIPKVPAGFETVDDDVTFTAPFSATSAPGALQGQSSGEAGEAKSSRRPSKKLIAFGLLLLGVGVCLSFPHSPFGVEVGASYILKKMGKPGPQSTKKKGMLTQGLLRT